MSKGQVLDDTNNREGRSNSEGWPNSEMMGTGKTHHSPKPAELFIITSLKASFSLLHMTNGMEQERSDRTNGTSLMSPPKPLPGSCLAFPALLGRESREAFGGQRPWRRRHQKQNSGEKSWRIERLPGATRPNSRARSRLHAWDTFQPPLFSSAFAAVPSGLVFVLPPPRTWFTYFRLLEHRYDEASNVP